MIKKHGILLTNGKITYYESRTEAYQVYIGSTVWKQLREERIKIDGSRCRLCNSPEQLEVHHRHYPEIFGTESINDLTTLCHNCHQIFTNEERQRKYSKREIMVDDVKRISPIIEITGNNHRELPNLEPYDYRRVSAVNAQWTTGRSVEQIRARNEENLLQEGQNRVRFRRAF